MDFKHIFELVLLIIAPIFSVGTLKKLIGKGVTALTGEVMQLGRWPKLIFSLGISFGFIVILQSHGVTGLPPEVSDRWAAVLLTAVSKSIYDLYNDSKKK